MNIFYEGHLNENLDFYMRDDVYYKYLVEFKKEKEKITQLNQGVHIIISVLVSVLMLIMAKMTFPPSTAAILKILLNKEYAKWLLFFLYKESRMRSFIREKIETMPEKYRIRYFYNVKKPEGYYLSFIFAAIGFALLYFKVEHFSALVFMIAIW